MDVFNLEQSKPNYSLENAPSTLNQISQIYQEQITKKHYRTPAGMTQPSIFKIGLVLLRYVDGSFANTSPSALKIQRNRMILMIVVGIILVVSISCVSIFTMGAVSEYDSDYEYYGGHILEFIGFLPFVIAGIALIIFVPFIWTSVDRYKKMVQQSAQKDAINIANLVDKIDFSEANRIELEKLMSPKKELYEIYRYKYYDDTIFNVKVGSGIFN